MDSSLGNPFPSSAQYLDLISSSSVFEKSIKGNHTRFYSELKLLGSLSETVQKSLVKKEEILAKTAPALHSETEPQPQPGPNTASPPRFMSRRQEYQRALKEPTIIDALLGFSKQRVFNSDLVRANRTSTRAPSNTSVLNQRSLELPHEPSFQLPKLSEISAEPKPLSTGGKLWTVTSNSRSPSRSPFRK